MDPPLEVPPVDVPPSTDWISVSLLPHAANITERAAMMTKERRPLRPSGFMVSPLVVATGRPAWLLRNEFAHVSFTPASQGSER